MTSQDDNFNSFRDFTSNSEVNLPAVLNRVEKLKSLREFTDRNELVWLLRAVTCLDLTTLAGDDTYSNVKRLCDRALSPLNKKILDYAGLESSDIQVAAVCVYPARVSDCVKAFVHAQQCLPIASVATGFPAGQTKLKHRLGEIEEAVLDGASEIDIVINRNLALTGKWQELYSEVCEMKKACGAAHMKTILATGELGSLTNVYKASIICMMAGADFIKTSTGKEPVNATLPVGLVMVRAIRDFYYKTGKKVGFKPAGGIRTYKDILAWQTLMKEELGTEWTQPALFRIGASSVLDSIEEELLFCVDKLSA